MDIEVLDSELPKVWSELPEEIKARRLQVRDIFLYRTGTSVTMASKLLGVSTRTIERDLKWIRECNKNWLQHDYNQSEFIGESIEVLKEIERRCFELSDMAMNQTIQRKEKDLHTGEMRTVNKPDPDYGSSRGHLETAMKARIGQLKILQTVGAVRFLPQELNGNSRLDISKMGLPELESANIELEHKISELMKKLKFIEESPDPFI